MKYFLAALILTAALSTPAGARILPCLNQLGGACGGGLPQPPNIKIMDPISHPCLNTTCLGPVKPPSLDAQAVAQVQTASNATKYTLNTSLHANALRQIPVNKLMNVQGVQDYAPVR